MKIIWALFFTPNDHDQPPNNLVAWWPECPSLEEVRTAMTSTGAREATVDEAIWVLAGHETKVLGVNYSGGDFRLQELEPGVLNAEDL